MYILLPELRDDDLINRESAAYELFWYYNTDDGIERDDELLDELIEIGEIDITNKYQYMYIRQMALLQSLNALISLYNSIWHKGKSKELRQKEIEQQKKIYLLKILNI